MLTPVHRKTWEITKYNVKENEVFFYSEAGLIRISVLSAESFRISYSDKSEFDKRQGFFLNLPFFEEFKLEDNNLVYSIVTSKAKLCINKKFGFAFIEKDGKIIFSEDSQKNKSSLRYDAFRLSNDGSVVTEDINTADGVKKNVVSAKREYYGNFCKTKTFFSFDEEEKIYGLGQYEEGVWNYRNSTRYIHQANKHISIPAFISSKGYGVMFTTASPAIFTDSTYGSYMYTTADYYNDYIVTVNDSFDELVSTIRRYTGKAAMLPKWAYSYVQSKERYETQDEIVSVAEEFVKRDIPLGLIVLDWFSWEEGMWGQKTFDSSRFYDVPKMVDRLHELGIHFMMSIWPAMDEKSDNYKEFKEAGLLLPGTNIYNPFDEEGRKLYWKQVYEGLASKKVESWWCDSSEPITPEWEIDEELIPEEKFNEFLKRCNDSLYVDKGNAYGLFHAKSIFEGTRRDFPERRVLNLTRSGYYGSHSLGAVLWSGDISASWDVLKRQIVEGLQLAMCGVAYWTLDIGAFFVKKGSSWYWNGEYEETNANNGYKELYTRWLQYGAFLSMFRSHGTDVSREPWNFGDKGDMFYDAIVSAIRLREKLMPYIYSLAYEVSFNDRMFIKPLFFASKDKNCFDIKNQFMMGDSIMVCPVTDPLYYDKEGKEIFGKNKKIKVYLPSDYDWYDYHTGELIKGGKTIEAVATIDRIPLYVKAGSIIPQSVNGKTVAYIYPGSDASFDIYNDSEEGYGYEKGEYGITRVIWNEKNKKSAIEFDGRDEYRLDIDSEILNSGV